MPEYSYMFYVEEKYICDMPHIVFESHIILSSLIGAQISNYPWNQDRMNIETFRSSLPSSFRRRSNINTDTRVRYT